MVQETRVGRVRYDVTANTARAERGLRRTGRGFNRMGREATGATRHISGLRTAFFGLASALGGRAIFNGIQSLSDYGGELNAVSQRTGFGIERLQSLRAVFEDLSVSQAQTHDALAFFALRLGEARAGLGTASVAFRALNVEFEKARPAEQVFDDVAGSIGNLADESARAVAAAQLFGARSGRVLAPLLNEDLVTLERRYQRFGTLSQQQAVALDDLGASFRQLSHTIRTQFAIVIADNSQAVENFTEALAVSLSQSIPNAIDRARSFYAFLRDNEYILTNTALALGSLFGPTSGVFRGGGALLNTSRLTRGGRRLRRLEVDRDARSDDLRRARQNFEGDRSRVRELTQEHQRLATQADATREALERIGGLRGRLSLGAGSLATYSALRTGLFDLEDAWVVTFGFTLPSITNAAFDGLYDIFERGAKILGGIFARLGDVIYHAFNNAFGRIGVDFDGLVNSINESVEGAFSFLGGVLGDVWSRLTPDRRAAQLSDQNNRSVAFLRESAEAIEGFSERQVALLRQYLINQRPQFFPRDQARLLPLQELAGQVSPQVLNKATRAFSSEPLVETLFASPSILDATFLNEAVDIQADGTPGTRSINLIAARQRAEQRLDVKRAEEQYQRAQQIRDAIGRLRGGASGGTGATLDLSATTSQASRAQLVELQEDLIRRRRVYAPFAQQFPGVNRLGEFEIRQPSLNPEVLREQIEEMRKLILETERAVEANRSLALSVEDALQTAFIGARGAIQETFNTLFTNINSLGDALRNLARVLAQSVLNRLLINPLTTALIGGGTETSPDGSPALGGFFGGFFASGGSVNPNRLYVVGERGPEIFIPNSSGAVVANDDLSGLMSGGVGVSIAEVNYNIDGTGLTAEELVPILSANNEALVTQVRREVTRNTPIREAIRGAN